MRCTLVPTVRKHLRHVAKHMRPEDRAEVWASSRATPEQALEDGFRSSLRCWTGLVNTEAVCIVGVAPGSLLTGVGIPWMLCTPRLSRAVRPMLRLSRPVVDTMQDFFPVLVNFVDARNTDTIGWLRALGFTVEEPAPFGPDRMPFHRFVREKPDV